MSFPQYESLSVDEIDKLLLNSEAKTNKAILYLMTRRSYLLHTTFKRKDSRSSRVEIVCKDEACPFYFLALPSPSSNGLIVKKHDLAHSCSSGFFEQEKRSSIPVSFYAEQLQPLVQSGKRNIFTIFFFQICLLVPNISVHGAQEHLRLKEIIPPCYSTTQKAKAKASEDRFGNIDEQFAKLPSLVDLVKKSDPAASIFNDTTSEGGFIRLFWSYSQAKLFGRLQRKLFSVDGASMKHHPKLTLLVLASEDMEDQQILLALQITKNEESELEWSSFLRRCKEHIEDFDSIDCGIISDRDKGENSFVLQLY